MQGYVLRRGWGHTSIAWAWRIGEGRSCSELSKVVAGEGGSNEKILTRSGGGKNEVGSTHLL